jgi:uncharacterized protein (DUF2384 family)
MFGYTLRTKDEWQALLMRLKEARSQDIQDRIDLLVEIKARLDSILKSNVALEREWLSAKQKFLDDRSPLDLLASRHLRELTLILGLLRKVTG